MLHRTIISFSLGFSLLELLISLTLGIMLLASVSYVYFGATSLVTTTAQNNRVQNNIRFVTHFLRHQINATGYAGCGQLKDLDLKNNSVFNFSTTNMIHGFNSDNLPPDSKLHKYRIAPKTDIIVIQKANEGIAMIDNAIQAGANSFHAKENPATEHNGVLLLADCVSADLIEATNVGGQLIRSKHKIAHQYLVGSTTVSRFTETAYFISSTTSGDKREIGLYYAVNGGNKTMLTDGINSMQVRYGIDHSSSGHVNDYYTADQITASNLWDKVVSVIVTLTQPITGSSKTKTISWDIYIKLRERCSYTQSK